MRIKGYCMVQERSKAELTLQKKMTLSGHLTQIIDTFPEKSCSIWDEMEKGVFIKWNRKDLLPNDREFTSRYVYKIKWNAKTGAPYRFKARLIVRGFEMEKHVDYDDNFSSTPNIALARIMVSLAAANNLELHSVDIEQAFTQDDKLPDAVNGRYFINPPPGSPDSGNRDIVYEVLSPLYGNPSSPRDLHKTMDAFFKSEGFDTIGFEESVWKRPAGGKYSDDILCQHM
jgi:hypothetical protein